MTNLAHRLRIETQFVQLMSELFQLDEAEALDFGIYRVIRHHNREVRAFLGDAVKTGPDAATLQGGQLAALLDNAFRKADHEAAAQDQARLKTLEGQLGITPGMTQAERAGKLQMLAAVPATKGVVDEYRTLLEQSADSGSAEHDRIEVLNRLYQFFERHYQDGDFIVERRYGRNGARYIRSTGEDTEFHWATEDMYYVKSGDIFTDYPVRLANGQRIVFSVEPESLQATRAQLKPNDKAHYELHGIHAEADRLQVQLCYLKGAQTDKQRDEIVSAIHARTGGDPADIKRWLARFIARNQSDFFIHKRLREALAEDLDIFLKTEVLDAEQLLAEHSLSLRALKVGRIVRQVGLQIIDFLAALENFQKALWEKKKLVLQTRYVITLDRLARHAPDWLAAHIDTIVATQRAEWQALGLGDFPDAAACRQEIPGDLASPAQTRYLPLPVDTAHFGEDFKWSLLAAVSAAMDLDEALDGVAIRSDNWQALNTLQARYREQVKCVYIDPPYNTNAGGIPYKNGYRHASWVSLMENRVDQLHKLLSNDGALFVSIDKVERTPLEQMLDQIFGANNRIEELIWVQNTNDGKSPTYSTNHEYVEVYAKQRLAVEQDRDMFREPKPGYAEVMELVQSLNPQYPSISDVENALKALYARHKAEYRDEIEAQGLDWEIERRNDPWKGLYPYSNAEYRTSDGKYIPESLAREHNAEIWVWRESDWTIMSSETKQSDNIRDPEHPNFRFYQPLHPITGKPCALSTRGWKGTQFIDPDHPDRNSFESLSNDHRIVFGPDETKVMQQKRMLHEVESNVSKSVFTEYADGEKQTTSMFGKAGMFLAPKHTKFVSRFILQGSKPDSTILDCFGGSGSTAHAVIEINRTEQSQRKFITVEVNRYFDTLIVPRLIKAACSGKWAGGKAKELDGGGIFLRIQALEQYEDTLENLALPTDELAEDDLFDDAAFALRYRLDRTSRRAYCGINHFASPFGYQLKRVEGGGDAPLVPVDLVESLIYLLGLTVRRLFREPQGVVVTGSNPRGQSVAVFFRDCAVAGSAGWVADKLAAHPADRVFANAVAELSFPGCDRLEAIETVFAGQFGGA